MKNLKWLILFVILIWGQSFAQVKKWVKISDRPGIENLNCNSHFLVTAPEKGHVLGKASENSKQNEFVISTDMTLSQVEQAMKIYPPSFEHGEQRLQIMESLDKIINFSVSDNFSVNPESVRMGYAQRLKEIVTFYRKRVDEGLEALEKTRVTEGVRVFKFYSSSVILKSADGTIAIDFAQGPIGNDYKQRSDEGEPEPLDYLKTGFYLTQEQRDRLANLVDVYLITHQHQDHADYYLAKHMIQAGKPVVGTEQLKYIWEDLSTGIIVPDFEKIQKYFPCEIFTQLGKQYAPAQIKTEKGEKFAIPSNDPSRYVESIRYLVKIAGITFLQSAEMHTEGYEWLEKAANFGWKVDVIFSAGSYQGERSVLKFLRDKQIQYFRLPIHEYEITHPNGGKRMAPLLKGDNREAFDQKKLMPLIWGENFLLTEEVINQ